MVKGAREGHVESSPEASVMFFLPLTIGVSDSKQTVLTGEVGERLPAGLSECLPLGAVLKFCFITHLILLRYIVHCSWNMPANNNSNLHLSVQRVMYDIIESSLLPPGGGSLELPLIPPFTETAVLCGWGGNTLPLFTYF